MCRTPRHFCELVLCAGVIAGPMLAFQVPDNKDVQDKAPPSRTLARDFDIRSVTKVAGKDAGPDQSRQAAAIGLSPTGHGLPQSLSR